MKTNRMTGAAALVITMLSSTLAGAETYPQTREGWLVGFGVGGGSAGLSANGESSNREGGFAGSFRVGYAFQPQVSLELDSNGWSREEGGTTTTFSVGTVALNYYPGGQAFVLRGGVGFGSADVSTQVGSKTLTGSESGFGLTLGAAYEFRIMRTLALSPQVDFGWMTLSEFDANYINGGLGLTWYFIPKK